MILITTRKYATLSRIVDGCSWFNVRQLMFLSHGGLFHAIVNLMLPMRLQHHTLTYKRGSSHNSWILRCTCLAFKISDTTRPKMAKISQEILLMAVALSEVKYSSYWGNITTRIHHNKVTHRQRTRRDRCTSFFCGRPNGVKHPDRTVENQGFKL